MKFRSFSLLLLCLLLIIPYGPFSLTSDHIVIAEEQERSLMVTLEEVKEHSVVLSLDHQLSDMYSITFYLNEQVYEKVHVLEEDLYELEDVTTEDLLDMVIVIFNEDHQEIYTTNLSEEFLQLEEAENGLEQEELTEVDALEADMPEVEGEAIVQSNNRGLHEGMVHEDVLVLKANLEKVGFRVSDKTSKVYDQSTVKAVTAFQQAFNLEVNGIATDETQKLLNELSLNSLYVGMKDPRVIELKKHLAIMGYEVSNVRNNAYGTKTAKIVKRFQTDYQLPATGAAYSTTLDLLNELATGPLRQGMYRDDVIILKVMLDQAGFRVSSKVTNYFGSTTTKRVKQFQKSKNLPQTGIVDKRTYNQLRTASGLLFEGLRHKDVVTMKLNLERAGFKVSNKPTNLFGSATVSKVKAFQKKYGLPQTGMGDKATLRMLDRVVNNKVPRKVKAIVDGSKNYGYSQMQKDIDLLTFFYPGLIETRVIGKSVDGRNIYAIKLGHGKKEVFFNGSHHAREHMTTNVLMKMIDEYARAYVGHTTIGSYNVRTVLNDVSIWFVPMVNPDGVMLVQQGARAAKNPSQVVLYNRGSHNFAGWKANIRGVDLNRQYPALWNTITNDPGRPSASNYKGKAPLTEPEAKALYDFTKSRKFMTAISYHSSGEVIFTRFNQEPHSRKLAFGVSRITGYQPIDLQRSQSGGGFTDWFILQQKKPALTPEISPHVGPRPVPLANWNKIWRENRTVGLYIADEARKRK
ncbi:peptidoglycan-binding protein [Alkalihalobacterium chitinilyticum]|uniref:Peptidoglycan-binding protein n=1 Tax=Alkalihalobacterium chitinilyticum TaxID=2980103 RepID=A0ABT5VF14_9BACI|nr:peptidoglycan-binding protein [Alkalihalobacterium chitinilyticum]MDE5414009.1 peptidoglycan-binding protein [Alkalihalobacterium chitinilyticum]